VRLAARTFGIGLLSAATGLGCAGRPLAESPGLIRTDAACPNPAYIALGPPDYAAVFETCLNVLDDYFEIAYANRYDGTIRSHPKVAPGLEQPLKFGSPDLRERLLATLQSIRYRSEIVIEPAPQGGYSVSVIVYKEIEDLARPIRATAGAASFQSDNTVDRQYEVVDPSIIDSNWAPLGRETHLEQAIVQRITFLLQNRRR
jgi:hypothetical protein